MTRSVGIDLGTTNSVLAVLDGGEPTVVVNAEGSRTTPSVVSFKSSREMLVGELAKRQAVTNDERTVRSVKRQMGSSWTIDIEDSSFTPQQVSAFVLQKLKRDAEAYLGETITDAVITVPAYFTDAQRLATKEAGRIAGLNVRRIVNEPTAAALAYGLGTDDSQTILVFDLGGGTLDVSLLDIGEGVVEVRATSGDNLLGGDDWDQRIVDWMVERFKAAHDIDLAKDSVARPRLREAAEKAKIELSGAGDAQILLPYLSHGPAGPLHFEERLTRAEFQRFTADLVGRCRTPFASVLDDVGIAVDDIDHVVLVGGSTRMPAVVELVRSMLGGKEPHKGVNPDEVVALGAALQAGVLQGEIEDVLLLDVTPLSLGVETRGGIMTPLIRRNTTIPAHAAQVFSTSLDDQDIVNVKIAQGEREFWVENHPLGTLTLEGLPPAKRGEPRIEVSFIIDADGILQVSARDQLNGLEQSTRLQSSSALAPSEVDRMVAEAQSFAEDDARRRVQVEHRNRGEHLVFGVTDLLAAREDQVEGELQAEARAAIERVALLLELDPFDIDTMAQAQHELAQAGRRVREAGTDAGSAPDAESPASGLDEVAEIEAFLERVTGMTSPSVDSERTPADLSDLSDLIDPVAERSAPGVIDAAWAIASAPTGRRALVPTPSAGSAGSAEPAPSVPGGRRRLTSVDDAELDTPPVFRESSAPWRTDLPGVIDVASGDELAVIRRSAAELGAVRIELAERNLELRRLRTEYESHRRRVERDRERLEQEALFSGMMPVIEALDGIDRARQHGPLDEGLRILADQLEHGAASRGLERYGADGDVFDPALHQAVQHAGPSADVLVPTCGAVIRSGYRVGDRVLRAAEVVVIGPAED